MKISKPTIVFLVVATAVLLYIIFFTGPKKQPPRPVQGLVQVPAQAPAGQAIPLSPAVQRKMESGGASFEKLHLAWDRDPFVLPKAPEEKHKKAAKTALKLTAILDGRGGRIAILDSEVVRKGDIVAGERVAEIDRDRVVLVRENARRVLILEEPVRSESDREAPAKDGKKSGDKVIK